MLAGVPPDAGAAGSPLQGSALGPAQPCQRRLRHPFRDKRNGCSQASVQTPAQPAVRFRDVPARPAKPGAREFAASVPRQAERTLAGKRPDAGAAGSPLQGCTRAAGEAGRPGVCGICSATSGTDARRQVSAGRTRGSDGASARPSRGHPPSALRSPRPGRDRGGRSRSTGRTDARGRCRSRSLRAWWRTTPSARVPRRRLRGARTACLSRSGRGRRDSRTRDGSPGSARRRDPRHRGARPARTTPGVTARVATRRTTPRADRPAP